MRAERVILGEFPLAWASTWHPAPRRQLYLQLSGTLEVRVSDGRVRQFSPNSLILLEDTTGKGHCARVLGSGRRGGICATTRARECGGKSALQGDGPRFARPRS